MEEESDFPDSHLPFLPGRGRRNEIRQGWMDDTSHGQGGEMARCGSTGVDISVPQDGNVWEICCTTLCISSTILCCTLKHRLMGQVSYCVFLTTIIFFEGGVSHFK